MSAPSRPWRHSLRLRLLLPLLLSIGGVLGLGGWAVYRLAQDQARGQLGSHANLYVDSVYLAAESVSNLADLQRHVANLGAEREVKQIIVTAGQPAQVIASSRRAWLGLPASAPALRHYRALLAPNADHLIFQAENESLLMARPIRLSNPDLAGIRLTDGIALVELDIGETVTALDTLERLILTVLAGTLLLTAGLAYWQTARRILSPVENLAGVMRRRTQGDRQARATVAGEDEVSELSRTLNAMFAAQDETEQDLRDAHQKLLHNADRLRLAGQVFDNSHDSIIITDANTHIQAVNPAFSHITGYTAEEVIGRKPGFLSASHREDDSHAAMWADLTTVGHWQGELWNRRKDGAMFPEWLSISAVKDETGLVNHYIGIGVDISERKAAEARIEHLAYYDALTNLPNRVLAADRLEQALAEARRHDGHVAVLFLDIDKFKNVNDTLGHLAGDQLLQITAQRLRGAIRATDTISRLGGDEFLVILPETDVQEAALVARKILGEFKHPFDLGVQPLNISTSIGITVFPTDGGDIETLLKHADMAMYHAKEAGRGRYSFFQPEMNDRVRKRLDLETQLQRALDAGEFSLHYQAKTDLPSGRLVGAEALIRWHSPMLGTVPPDQFIPVAEESDLILKIGDWVINEACRQLAAWRSAGLAVVPVAINLSLKQFAQTGLVERIRAVTENHGIPPGLIELEVTESLFMQESESVVAMLQALREAGFHVSLDDFGTGYSSLAYLKRMPLDTLKIDRTFVRDLAVDTDDAAIVSAVIQLGHTLGMKVIAEGVESAEQLAYLQDRQCDEAQGFYLHRPVPAADFGQLIGNRG